MKTKSNLIKTTATFVSFTCISAFAVISTPNGQTEAPLQSPIEIYEQTPTDNRFDDLQEKVNTQIGWAAQLRFDHPDAALAHLQQAQEYRADDLEILEISLEIIESQSSQFLKQEKQEIALEYLEYGQNFYHRAASVYQSSEATNYVSLFKLNKRLKDLEEYIHANIHRSARLKIQIANEKADNAHRIFWFNSRDEVIEGLKALQWVSKFYPILTDELRGDFHRSVSQLKKRVSDKEWSSLCASAGFSSNVI